MTHGRALLPLLVALAACGKEAAEPSPVAVTRTMTDAGETVVRLLDQGAEPRRVLRYDLSEWNGTEATLRMKMSMRMGFDSGEPPDAVELPVVEMRVTYTPEGVDGDGNLRVVFAMGGMNVVDAEPELAEAFRAAAQRLGGLRGTSLVTPGGCVLESDVEVPADAPPGMKQMLEGLQGNLRQLSTPFPGQPVGAGARWDVTTPARLVGIGMDTRTTYRLEELTATGGTIRFDVAATGSGTPAIPELEDVEARIESMRIAGTGAVRFDLRRLVPRMEMRMRSELKVGIPPDRLLNQDIDLRLELFPSE